jgi:methyltransferase (TIGR00027 family)
MVAYSVQLRQNDSRPRGQVRPSVTAEITCAQRAAETLLPPNRRLINDPYAKYFLRSRAVKLRCANAAVARLTLNVFDRRYPGFMAIVLLRNRRYEQLLARAVAERVHQVVLLGAGYDTTSLRLNLGGATLFEVDAPPTQEAKREAIARHHLPTSDAVRYVPCDFERDQLPDRLTSHGFQPSARSLFVWYGVSFFLSEPAVQQTMTDIAELTSPGSWFVMDYLDPSVVAGTTEFIGAARARAAVQKRGEPYTFGLSHSGADQLLQSHGFDVESNLSITDLARDCGDSGVWFRTDDFFGIATGVRSGGGVG